MIIGFSVLLGSTHFVSSGKPPKAPQKRGWWLVQLVILEWEYAGDSAAAELEHSHLIKPE